jgi:hypothetical protein
MSTSFLPSTLRKVAAVLAMCLLASPASAGAQQNSTGASQTYTLLPTPATVAWGHYDATTTPVLHIHSGDTVVFHTVLTSSPTALEKAGVKPVDVEQSLRDLFDGVAAKDRGPGGHILTGPVAIDGAEPGDTLEVRIKKIDLAIPYAYNGFRYGAGFQTDDFPYARMKIIPLDRTKRIAHSASIFRCARFSAAWEWRRRPASVATTAHRPRSSAAIWTTRS